MDLEQLFAYADAHQPPQYALPVRLQPFMPDLVSACASSCSCLPLLAPPRRCLFAAKQHSPTCLQVPALGAPCTFTAPPRPDGEPDFLGLTVLVCST